MFVYVSGSNIKDESFPDRHIGPTSVQNQRTNIFTMTFFFFFFQFNSVKLSVVFSLLSAPPLRQCHRILRINAKLLGFRMFFCFLTSKVKPIRSRHALRNSKALTFPIVKAGFLLTDRIILRHLSAQSPKTGACGR